MWPNEGAGDGRTEAAIQRFSEFWPVAYHCLFFADFYLWDCAGDWATPPDFTNGPEDQGIDEHGAARFPNVHYSKAQLLGYAEYCRARARAVLATVTDAQLSSVLPGRHPHHGKTFGSLLDINLQHVREHGGRLADFVASGGVSAS